MPDSSDDLDFDAALTGVLAACRDEQHTLDEPESRILAAAFAQIDTPLQHWGDGVVVADSHRLVEDAQWLVDAASIERSDNDPHRYPDHARNALSALIAYFARRAQHRPTREDYLRELSQIYIREIEFLRARGHRPYVAWTGDGHGCTGLAAPLDDTHEIYATNGHACLIGSATHEISEGWLVGVYELDTGDLVTQVVVRSRFEVAYTDAIASLPTRPTTTTAPLTPGTNLHGIREDESHA